MFVSRDYNFQSTDKTSPILRCGTCGSVFPETFPTPETLGQAYGNYYTTSRRTGRGRPLARLLNAARRDYLRRSAPDGVRRVLDYGCGSGEYLSSLLATGFVGEAWGTDLFKVDSLSEAIHWIALDDLDAGPTFDWITLGHVLEHVDQPRPLLERLTGRLAPDGAIWISTPNADSFLMKTTRHWTRDVDFPRHREVYTREGLTAFLASLGLDARFVSPPPVNAAPNALSSLKNVMADRQAPLRRRLRAVIETLAALVGHLLSEPTTRQRTAPELIVVCKATG